MFPEFRLDPVTISLLSFVVSVLSLAISVRNNWVNKRVQFEQLRGRIRSRLTSRGIEVINALRGLPENDLVLPQTVELVKKLDSVLDSVEHTRKSVENIPYSFIVELQGVFGDIEDAEPVWDNLLADIKKADYVHANTVANGLLERFYSQKSGDGIRGTFVPAK